MLLITTKHSRSDLKAWDNVCYQYQLYYKLNNKKLDKKLNKSLNLIKLFFQNHQNCYASISWGKDSTILAYLIYLSQLPIPCVQTVCYTTNPDNELVKNDFCANYDIDYHEVFSDDSVLDRFSFDQSVINKFFEPVKVIFGNHKILGIRGDESNIRKYQQIKYKGITSTSCHPLIHWSLDDVFSFLINKNIPIHPVYGYSMGGLIPLKDLRVDTLGDIRGRDRGRKEWENIYYQDELKQMNIYD
jgi:phosphoadenosine phosphosulfate reductase